MATIKTLADAKPSPVHTVAAGFTPVSFQYIGSERVVEIITGTFSARIRQNIVDRAFFEALQDKTREYSDDPLKLKFEGFSITLPNDEEAERIKRGLLMDSIAYSKRTKKRDPKLEGLPIHPELGIPVKTLPKNE